MTTPPYDPRAMLAAFLEPWRQAVADPATTQAAVLQRLLGYYAQTVYGAEHAAGSLTAIEEYRRAFPVCTYDDYRPLIERMMAGEPRLLTHEDPTGWAMTRGTSSGNSKFIPLTPAHLRLRDAAARVFLAYVAESGRMDIFQGVDVNLSFPSRVGTVKMGEREVRYGYSSGIYAHDVAQSILPLVPEQAAIDALGSGKSQKEWEARFELAYQSCKERRVTVVGGVAPVILEFGRYLHKRHRVYPKDIWQPMLMPLASVPGINTYLAPALRAMYGSVVIREIYGATEGVFGQQRDEKRAWVPNYDQFLFEAQTRSAVKMLHEMRPGEIGSLIVSTPVLPRYKINDLILALHPPYFRCIGRDTWWTPFRYAYDELMTMNLGRL